MSTAAHSHKRIDPAGLATGLAAGYGTKLAILFVVLVAWIILSDVRPEITFFGFVRSVRQLPYGNATVIAASILGVIVGAFAAATYSRGKELATGIAVGGVIIGLRAAFHLLELASGRGIAFTELAATFAVVPIAWLGAKTGEQRRRLWDRQCEELDGWKQPQDGGQSSS